MKDKLQTLCQMALTSGESGGMFHLNHDLPKIVIERYSNTLVISDHTPDGAYRDAAEEISREANFSLLYKWKNSRNFRERNGIILAGTPDNVIVEHNVQYAVDLTLNQDCSFYGDTRNLRKYLIENSANKTVLNTFAYTGSLGIAALAGNAAQVVQSDLSGKFLTLAGKSVELNGFDAGKMEIVEGNFFPVMSAFKKAGKLFDTVILDPPFFSQSSKGTVDLLNNPVGPVNKVRPLVRDGGEIIMVNNALYLSGRDFLAAADALCDGKYLTRGSLIDIPEEYCNATMQVADPAPFNHSTKIIIFKVARKG